MILRQIFEHPVSGYWDGGPKTIFDWKIDGTVREDAKGKYIKIGSWAANYWFHVAVGKTEKATLGNARRRLNRSRFGVPCKFEYIEE